MWCFRVAFPTVVELLSRVSMRCLCVEQVKIFIFPGIRVSPFSSTWELMGRMGISSRERGVKEYFPWSWNFLFPKTSVKTFKWNIMCYKENEMKVTKIEWVVKFSMLFPIIYLHLNAYKLSTIHNSLYTLNTCREVFSSIWRLPAFSMKQFNEVVTHHIWACNSRIKKIMCRMDPFDCTEDKLKSKLNS